ncbi:MAG: hypothetical protein RIG68_09395 [Imperialibacter sp.]|uniref:hypothetical protein n=1 Tax=Imperialibacter sp. TaxID=2038411 RepID=UPI0032EFE85B
MNYESIIEFNKYTLALSAGGFAYVLDSYKEPATPLLFWLVVVVCVLLAFSTLAGILVYSTATSKTHQGDKESPGHDRFIRLFGTSHALFLAVAMLGLAVIVFSDIQYPKDNEQPEPRVVCCCERPG